MLDHARAQSARPVWLRVDAVRAWRAEAGATLALGWPIALTNLAQISLLTTDAVMLGWLGPEPLAASVLGINLYFASFIFGMGLANACPPVMAQALGRDSSAIEDVRRTVHQGIWLTSTYGLLIFLVLANGEMIMLALGQEPALAALAGDYLFALMWGTLPGLWLLVLRGFVAALERPRSALIVTLAAIVLNALSNYLLIFGHYGFPALGIVGAGVSSTISNIFMAGALFVWVRRSAIFRRFDIGRGLLRPDLGRLMELVRLGTPIGLTMAFESIIFNLTAFLMGPFGATAVAAHGIALQSAAITFMIPMSLGQAATVRVGLAVGAGDVAGVRRAGWTAIALGLAFMAAMAVVFLAFPEAVASLYLDGDDPDTPAVIATAMVLLQVAGIFQLVDGGQTLGAGVLRGLKDTRMPLIFAGTGYWIAGLPVGVVLAYPLGFGPIGLWIGLATGLLVVAVLMLGRWSLRERLGLIVSAGRAG